MSFQCCLCGYAIEREGFHVFSSDRIVRQGSEDIKLWDENAKAHKLCYKRFKEGDGAYPFELNRKIRIPFRLSFAHALFGGVKTATSRTKRYGIPGDTFIVSGRTFRLLRVKAEKLSIIPREYWREEGCSSPDEFISIWQGIHPRKGWDPEQFVFLHEFELLGYATATARPSAPSQSPVSMLSCRQISSLQVTAAEAACIPTTVAASAVQGGDQ